MADMESPVDSEMPSIDSLPEEILARILSLLQPCQLHWVERVNKRLRATVVQNKLWRQHCANSCSNFQTAVADIDAESLRRVLTQLRQLADAQSPNDSSASAQKPIRVVAFPSQGRSSSSPLLRSDEEVRQGSPKSRARPFWGPGLPQPDSPTTSANRTSSATTNPTSPSPNPQPSILTRLHQLCTGERNLTTSNNRVDANGEASSSNGSGSSKLWHFDVNMTQDVLRSMFYKRLCWRLGACPAKLSLIAEALQASSTDRPSEKIQNVLNPMTQARNPFSECYWSSGPSDDVNSSETLDFKLAHPLCVIHEIQLQPYEADQEPGSFTYPSQCVCFHFASSLQQLATAGQDGWSGTSTAQYPVAHNSTLQSFRIPPVLCVGGYMRIELIGRVQLQVFDHRYYTCVCYTRVVGTPVYGFLPKGLVPPATATATQLLDTAVDSGDSPHTADSATTSVSSALYHQLQSGLTFNRQPGMHEANISETAVSDTQAAAEQSLSQTVILEAVLKDPVLSAKGGLRRFSEMGRTLPETMFADDLEVQGDSDDNDFQIVQQGGLDESSDDEDGMNLGHGVGFHLGQNLVNVPANQLLNFIMGDMGEGDEYYPVMDD